MYAPADEDNVHDPLTIYIVTEISYTKETGTMQYSATRPLATFTSRSVALHYAQQFAVHVAKEQNWSSGQALSRLTDEDYHRFKGKVSVKNIEVESFTHGLQAEYAVLWDGKTIVCVDALPLMTGLALGTLSRSAKVEGKRLTLPDPL